MIAYVELRHSCSGGLQLAATVVQFGDQLVQAVAHVIHFVDEMVSVDSLFACLLGEVAGVVTEFLEGFAESSCLLTDTLETNTLPSASRNTFFYLKILRNRIFKTDEVLVFNTGSA